MFSMVLCKMTAIDLTHIFTDLWKGGVLEWMVSKVLCKLTANDLELTYTNL